MKIGVSSCLLGNNCKYNGKNNYNKTLTELLLNQEVVTICPEVLGGLSTPRVPSEILNGKVINKDGIDVTKEFILGANKSLNILKENNINVVILKKNSPSCGYKQIYDGTFTNTLTDGNGITSKLFLENGITIFTEDDVKKVKSFLEMKNN